MTKRGYQRLFYFVVDVILCVILYKLIRSDNDKNNKKKELQMLKDKENIVKNNIKDDKEKDNI